MKWTHALLGGFLIACLVLTGCGGDETKAKTGGDATSTESGGVDPHTIDGTAKYSAIDPKSDNEKKVVANVDKAYATFKQGEKLTAEQNPNTPVYNGSKDGTYIGQEYRFYSDKGADGKYAYVSVFVLNGTPTTSAVWSRTGAATAEDLNEYFVIKTDADQRQFDKKFEGAGANEAASHEIAKKWVAEVLPDEKFAESHMIGYVLKYGEVDGEWLVMSVYDLDNMMGMASHNGQLPQ